MTPHERKQLRDLAIDIGMGYPVSNDRAGVLWTLLYREGYVPPFDTEWMRMTRKGDDETR